MRLAAVSSVGSIIRTRPQNQIITAKPAHRSSILQATPSHSEVISLANVGDAVWEVYQRRRHFLPPQHVSKYREKVGLAVCAETQAAVFDFLTTSSPVLQPDEVDLLTTASRYPVRVSRRRLNTAGGKVLYSKATAVEALVGHLYLQRQVDRLEAVLDSCEQHIEELAATGQLGVLTDSITSSAEEPEEKLKAPEGWWD